MCKPWGHTTSFLEQLPRLQNAFGSTNLWQRFLKGFVELVALLRWYNVILLPMNQNEGGKPGVDQSNP